MSTRVEKTIMVNVPVSRAYNQWTQFEDFPQFMGGVQSVTQRSDDRLDWVAEIAGVRRQWEARITEQVPDRKIAWAATEGATNAGAVMFEDVGGEQTAVTLVLDYEPEGMVEKVGDSLSIVERQAEGDLERFKSFIEDEGYASGAWRGSVGTPGQAGVPDTDDAAASRGDSGKAGISPKAVAAGVGVAAAAATAAVVSSKGGSEQTASAREADTASGRSSTPQTDTGTRMLTDEEIEAAASTDPYQASELDAEPTLTSRLTRPTRTRPEARTHPRPGRPPRQLSLPAHVERAQHAVRSRGFGPTSRIGPGARAGGRSRSSMASATDSASCRCGRCSRIVNRVARSTRVPIAEPLSLPMIRSPSQCPGTVRPSTSLGRLAMRSSPGTRGRFAATLGARRARPVRQGFVQVSAQVAASLDVQLLVDRLVTDPHRLIIGEHHRQPVRDLLRAHPLATAHPRLHRHRQHPVPGEIRP